MTDSGISDELIKLICGKRDNNSERREQKVKKLNKAAQLTLLLSLTYMISYITRVSYGTVISEIEKNTHIAKSLLAHGLTGSFITYGAGQIISGILGDRFSAKRLISCGLALTTMMNILIPSSHSPLALTVIMCINGLAQSLMWPPMVKIMTAQLSDDEYKSRLSRFHGAVLPEQLQRICFHRCYHIFRLESCVCFLRRMRPYDAAFVESIRCGRPKAAARQRRKAHRADSDSYLRFLSELCSRLYSRECCAMALQHGCRPTLPKRIT